MPNTRSPPPSHPHSVVMRNRWGMPHDFKSLGTQFTRVTGTREQILTQQARRADSTSQTVVKAAEKLSVIADEIADARRKDREHEFWGGGGGGGEALEEAEAEEEAEAGERRPPSSQFVRNRNMRGSLSDSGLAGLVEQGVLTGTDGYRGSRPASREGAGGEVVQVLQVLEEEDRGRTTTGRQERRRRGVREGRGGRRLSRGTGTQEQARSAQALRKDALTARGIMATSSTILTNPGSMPMRGRITGTTRRRRTHRRCLSRMGAAT